MTKSGIRSLSAAVRLVPCKATTLGASGSENGSAMWLRPCEQPQITSSIASLNTGFVWRKLLVLLLPPSSSSSSMLSFGWLGLRLWLQLRRLSQQDWTYCRRAMGTLSTRSDPARRTRDTVAPSDAEPKGRQRHGPTSGLRADDTTTSARSEHGQPTRHRSLTRTTSHEPAARDSRLARDISSRPPDS
jgi:hypothetical protein